MSEVVTNVSAGLRRGWHPVARAEEVGGEPLRVELLGEGWVLARLDGELRGFRDRCPHRFGRISDGTVVSGERGAELQCPYHGWRFDASGTCCAVPALGDEATPPSASLTRAHVTERYGLVWLAPDEPECDVIEIDEAADPDLVRIDLPAIDVAAGAAQIIDNFLDFAHFPFVHAGTFGSSDDEVVGDYQLDADDDGWGLTVRHDHTIANREDPLVATGEHPLVQPRSMRYRYRAPLSATLRLDLPLPESINVLAMLCQPLDVATTRVYMWMLRNDCATAEEQRAALDFEIEVFAEDRAILEHLPDTSLPVDPAGTDRQLHTRADRHTALYRRILRRFATHSASG